MATVYKGDIILHDVQVMPPGKGGRPEVEMKDEGRAPRPRIAPHPGDLAFFR
jgi:hypothetical protein